MYEMTADVLEVLHFVKGIMDFPASENMKAIGLKVDGEMAAGVIYDGFNGQNVWMHIAAKPKSGWKVPEYFQTCMKYPFETMKVKRASSFIAASNLPSIKLCESLGFVREAVLKDAAPDGGDVFVYVLWPEQNRYANQDKT